jgi:hypothetical protein
MIKVVREGVRGVRPRRGPKRVILRYICIIESLHYSIILYSSVCMHVSIL